MKILIAMVALIPYLVAGRAEQGQVLKQLDFHVSNADVKREPLLYPSENTFNTVVKNKKTTRIQTNATSVEVIVPLTSEINVLNFIVKSNNVLEIDYSTNGSKMITGIRTSVSTTSSSGETVLEIDIITRDRSSLEHYLTTKATAAPVDHLNLQIVLETPDIDWGNLYNYSNWTQVEALPKPWTTIKEIITTSETKEGSTSLVIELKNKNTWGTTITAFSTSSPEGTISSKQSTQEGNKTSAPYHTSVANTTATSIKPVFSTSENPYSNVTSIAPVSSTGGLMTPNTTTIRPAPSFQTSTLQPSSLNTTKTTMIETTTFGANVTTTTQTKSTTEKSYSNITSSVPVGWTTHNWHTTTPTPDVCGDREYSCVDCNTARVCAPTAGGDSLWEVTQFLCPDYAPWCNTESGTCSTVPSDECNLPVFSNFTCMRNGHFPDPNSCSHYYLCDNSISLEFTCLYPSAYYSPVTQSCVNSSSVCLDYLSLCHNKTGLKVPVPNTNSLFFYCVDGHVQVVDKCIGAYQFHSQQQACVPHCPHAGLFPSDLDCADYYRCSPQADHYLINYLTCPQGLAFLESAYDCVDRSLVPNCNVTCIS